MSISEHEAKTLADFETYEAEVATLRVRVAELEREMEGMRGRAHAAEAQRDEAVSLAHESLTESVRAKADAARLREALAEANCVLALAVCGELTTKKHVEEAHAKAEAALASAPSAEPEGPDYSGLCSAPRCGGHCGFAHAVGCEAIREYLAEHGGDAYKAPARTAHLAPSAEPREAYMRVAEAVREACARHLRMSPRFEGVLTTPNDNGVLGRAAQDLENLDLAAVVAKAVGT